MKLSLNVCRVGCAFALLLSGCDDLDQLLGDESRLQQALPGERIAVLNYRSELTADPALQETPFRLPPPQINLNFVHETALQQAGINNLSVKGMELVKEVRIGNGNEWEDNALMQQPVIAGGMIFAMDAHGVVSAHEAENIDHVLWRTETTHNDELEASGGGGLSYAGGVVYVTTGYGSVIALVAADGSILWRKETGVPVRAAPTAAEGQVYVSTIENQLLSYAMRTGQLLWEHRGIGESAVYLGTASPVIENGIVIAAYTSGELFALRAEDGSLLWSDSLMTSRRTSASAILTGITATPLVRDNIVYAVSNTGLMVANLLSSGRGIWDMELTSTHTPWIAGDYIFVLTADQRLMALHRFEKRIRWIRPLRSLYEHDESLPSFTAPLIINSRLLLISDEGEMLWLDPQTGALDERRDLVSGVRAAPAISEGRLYVLSDDATLYQYE